MNLKRFQVRLEKHYQFWPHFKGAIRAINSTHIRVVITPNKDAVPYIDRKGYPTQNVMAICNFDMLLPSFKLVGKGLHMTHVSLLRR